MHARAGSAPSGSAASSWGALVRGAVFHRRAGDAVKAAGEAEVLEDAHEKRLGFCRSHRHPRARAPQRPQQRGDAGIDARLEEADVAVAHAIELHRALGVGGVQSAELLKALIQRRAYKAPQHVVAPARLFPAAPSPSGRCAQCPRRFRRSSRQSRTAPSRISRASSRSGRTAPSLLMLLYQNNVTIRVRRSDICPQTLSLRAAPHARAGLDSGGGGTYNNVMERAPSRRRHIS